MLERAEELKEKLVQIRRTIHMNPETSFTEFKTAALVSETLSELGVEHQNGVGITGVVARLGNGNGPVIGIRADMEPGRLAFPDQIVDYTWGRHSTFFEDNLKEVTHIDFTEPYCSALREKLIQTARNLGMTAHESCAYGATQGPRLETAAEIRRMERDGCDMVGMTGMPEAALARELGLSYAACAVVANWAAGKSSGPITMAEIERNLASGMDQVKRLLAQVIPTLEAV